MKILFLGANGIDTARLRLGKEVQQIKAEIALAQAKQLIEVCVEFAVEPTDLSRLLLQEKPDVVHFSGHGLRSRADSSVSTEGSRGFLPEAGFVAAQGSESALLFENSDGRSVPVSSVILAELFRVLKTSRCVVLNACFSAPLAEKIAQYVDCTIGMARDINDEAALAFAIEFYRTIAYGEKVRDAFDLGCNAARTKWIPGVDVPRFYARRPELGNLVLVPRRPPSQAPGARPTPPPPSVVAIAEIQVIPNNEDEQRRLDRAVLRRADEDNATESTRRFLRKGKFDAPWGRYTINALRPYPSLLARYYPDHARPLLPGYDGFDFRDFARKYRAKVADRCQDHRLLGLPPTQLRREDLQAKMSLSSLFVPLRFRPDKDGAQRTSLAELLAARKNVVVLGDPGMGKSTLMGFLALLFAGGTKLEGFSPSLPTIPMPISLRDFVHEQRRQHKELRFIDYLALRAKTDYQLSSSHWAFFDATLRMGEAVVFFDGLDEVGGDASRLDIARKIVAFQDEYPHVPIWVTSRVYGYTKNIALPALKFEHVRIQDLDDDQVGDFLKRWYGLQFPENPRARDELRQSLHDAVFRTPRVRHLAGCPLLLTLMAFIHRVVQSLPQDRAELYDQCVKMLLDTWQKARRGPVGEVEPHPFERLNLHISVQKDYLAHLALFIQEKNQSANSEDARGIIDRADALECLAKRHYDVAGRSRTHMRLDEAREEIGHFLDYIGDRTGLLLDRGGGKLSFIHLSFQEYLAAWLFILDPYAHDNPVFFKQHLGKQAWEEVLLLRLYVIRHMEGGGGERVFDAVTSAMFRELARVDIADGWLTLVRALRDNLDFTAPQQEAILNAAIAKWLEAPHLSGTWFAALEEVRLFSEKVAPVLRSRLAMHQAQAKGHDAIACLHLEAELFGVNEDSARRFRDRPDLPLLIADLIPFMPEPDFASLLADKATVHDWIAAFCAFDGQDAYGMTLGWATGALVCPVKSDTPLIAATRWMQQKIAEEATSRRSRAEAQSNGRAPSFFETIGSIRVGTEHFQVVTPFTGSFGSSRLSGIVAPPKQHLHCAALAAERAAETCLGRMPLQKALTARAQAWIHQWLTLFPIRWTELPGDIAALSTSFGEEFGRSFGRDFVREFGRDFVRRFASRFEDLFTPDFIRNFVCYFGRSFIRYFVRDFGRAFVPDYAASYAREFVRCFVVDEEHDAVSELGREFIRHFGSQLGVSGDHSNTLEQFEWAMRDDRKVRSLLMDDPFWDWMFFSVLPNVDLSSHQASSMQLASPANPFAIPLLLANLFTAAALHQIFNLGRHFAGLSQNDEDLSDEALTAWLHRHPVDVHPVAWTWDEHADQLAKTYGKLLGPRGALAMTHAEYAALMTGIKLDTTITWKNLVDARHSDVNAHLIEAESAFDDAVNPLPPGEPSGPRSLRFDTPNPIFSWIQVSDLHMGHPDPKRRAAMSLITRSLLDDVCRHSEFDAARVDAIVVTGDVAWNGKRDQYEDAQKYLLELAAASGLSPDRILVVPGNHDVDRDESKVIVKHFVNSLRQSGGGTVDDYLADMEIKSHLASRQAAYLEFASAFAPFRATTPMPRPEARLHWNHSLNSSDGRRVRFIGMNTALLAGDKNDRGKLHVGLTPLRETLSGVDEEELVILVSHHPFGGGWLADEREVDREARCRVHLHLAGHVHDEESDDHRCGGGTGMIRITTGIIQTEIGAPVEFGYNFACVFPEPDGDGYRVRVHPRRWSNRNRDFRQDNEALPRDTRVPWVEHEIPRIGRKRKGEQAQKS